MVMGSPVCPFDLAAGTCERTMPGPGFVIPVGTVWRSWVCTFKRYGLDWSSLVAASAFMPFTSGIVMGAAWAPILTVKVTRSPLVNAAPNLGSVETTFPTFALECVDMTFVLSGMPLVAIFFRAAISDFPTRLGIVTVAAGLFWVR